MSGPNGNNKCTQGYILTLPSIIIIITQWCQATTPPLYEKEEE